MEGDLPDGEPVDPASSSEVGSNQNDPQSETSGSFEDARWSNKLNIFWR